MPKAISALLFCRDTAVANVIHPLLKRCVHHRVNLVTVSDDENLPYALQDHQYDILLLAEPNIKSMRDILTHLSRARSHQSPVVIALTQKDTPASYQQCLQMGAKDCLPLPSLTTTLLERSMQYALSHHYTDLQRMQFTEIDLVTGLCNDQRFTRHLSELLQQSKRSQEPFALILIGLDHFDSIQTEIGKESAEELLAQVGQRIANSVRESDLVARLEDNVFAIIAGQIAGGDDVDTLANSLQQACLFPLDTEAGDSTMSCSLGIALYPQDGHNNQQLLAQAKAALHQSFDRGGACYHYADHRLNHLMQRRKLLSRELAQALPMDQLELYFQPIIALRGNVFSGVEVLLRWQHPRRGLLEPGYFLAIAEDSGLLKEIGHWTFSTACRMQREWADTGLPLVPLAVNLSLSQLNHATLVSFIDKLKRQKGFNPRYLTIELSEEDCYSCNQMAIDSLYELKHLGVRLTVDNFGKGFSSLSHLQDLPVDNLKIDRSLINDMSSNHKHAETSSLIIQLGKLLHYDVIAQGVEDETTLRLLDEEQCSKYQGYSISPPLPAKRFFKWYQRFMDQQPGAALH